MQLDHRSGYVVIAVENAHRLDAQSKHLLTKFGFDVAVYLPSLNCPNSVRVLFACLCACGGFMV